MSVLMPLGAQPTAMAGRNWMLRRMMIEMIRSDPAYNNGNYTTQPPSFRLAANFFSMATSGGTQALQHAAPTRAQADKIVEERLAARFTADANDYIYSYEAARDYDPSPDLEKIKARVLAINAADDERNPAELGILQREIKRVKNGRYYQIPASAETRGHGTSGEAKWWKQMLAEVLSEAPTPGQ
jgi:homoserine O-acetyltransferase/O-succinyltransferase